jgi:hypothetical protein
VPRILIDTVPPSDTDAAGKECQAKDWKAGHKKGCSDCAHRHLKQICAPYEVADDNIGRWLTRKLAAMQARFGPLIEHVAKDVLMMVKLSSRRVDGRLTQPELHCMALCVWARHLIAKGSTEQKAGVTGQLKDLVDQVLTGQPWTERIKATMFCSPSLLSRSVSVCDALLCLDPSRHPATNPHDRRG